ncbi:MAG: hypothetical protein HUJ26_14100 [Planctomycetaceae bacterium]|nr:hypothetical protein [Planctomycetaceae bacterium]
MPEELRLKLNAVRRRLRSSLWQGGVCALLTGILFALLLSGTLDWLVVGNSLSGRLFLSLSTLGIILWVIVRELWKPLAHPLSDDWLAQRLEEKIPELGGQLASTVEFSSHAYDERYGSRKLQQKTVDRSIRKLLTLDLIKVIDPRPVRIRARLAMMFGILATMLLLLFPAHAWTAMQRLALPWKSIEWPREVVLELQDAKGVPLEASHFTGQLFPRGSDLELRVINRRGELPSDLELQVRQGDDDALRREAIPTISANEETPAYGQIHLPLRGDSIDFRIVGGDDDRMSWRTIKVVPPPVLSDLQLTLIPPEYQDETEVEIPSGTSFVQALIGSRLRVVGTANVPLAEASFLSADRYSMSLTVEEGAANFSGELPITEVGSQFFRLRLQDPLGISNPSALRLEVVGLADQIPEVKILSPETDQFLTPDAELRLHIAASDDVLLTELSLQLAPKSEPNSERAWRTTLLESPAPRIEEEWTLKLRDLGFEEGDVLLLRLVGRDHLSIDEEHLGVDERLLTVLSPSEKQRELSERLEGVIEQIERVSGRQSILRESMSEALEDGESLPDLLSDQKRIERQLLDAENSLQADLQKLVAEAELNHLQQPRFQKRLNDLQRDFQRLEQTEFPQLNQSLGRLSSQAPSARQAESLLELPEEQTLADPEALENWLQQQPEDQRAGLLGKIAEHQQENIETILQDMAGSFSEWKKQQSLQDSLAELMENQKEIARKTRELNSRLSGKSTGELNLEAREQLQQLSADQLRNQGRLREFQELLDRELEAESPPPQVKDLSESVNSSDASTRMTDNQRALRENHLNEANDRHQDLLQEFQEWDDQLNNRPVTDAELKMQLLDEQARKLEQLKRDQQQLGNQLDNQLDNQPPNNPQEREELQSQQKNLQQEAGRIRRMLDRLQLPKSAEAMQAAERPMQKLAERLEENRSPEQLPQQAEQKLGQAQEAIEQERKGLESDHQLELLTELLPRLMELALAQKQLNQSASQLLREYDAAHRWNRSLLKKLNDVRDGQQESLTQLNELKTALEEIGAVKLALAHLLETMNQSHQHLSDRELPPAVSTTMPRSLRQFEILIDVLERLANESENDEASEQQADNGEQEESAEEDQKTVYVELLLLRAVQQQIQEEARELSRQEFEEGSSEETRKAWQRLETEQAEVLRLLEEIITRQQQEQAPVEEVI